MQKAELIFIPSSGAGHFLSTLEIAKLLVNRDPNLSITFLIIKFPNSNSTLINDLTRQPLDRIQFIDLPSLPSTDSDPKTAINTYIQTQKPHAKEVVTARFAEPKSPQLAGFVVDMFCTPMIDVADELGVSSYVFFTSGAAFLGLVFHAQYLNDELGKPSYEFDKNSDTELIVPCFQNPFPARVLPSPLLNRELFDSWCNIVRRFRKAKGIIVNTFSELESHAVNSLTTESLPSLYPVGPLLNLKGKRDDEDKKSEITGWLDGQPNSSVVFLCFGSMGSFGVDQVKEIAYALEKSGHRFLWSLRKPTSSFKDKVEIASDYEDFSDVVPEGFLDRTVGIGKVIGWAPQVDVLAHEAIGGFVSHCGWNSVLESIWFGVPIATWPLYAEQQANAFQLVKELGLAVEVKMDYRKNIMIQNDSMVITVDEIERGIIDLMERGDEVRKRVKDMSLISRRVFMEGGSSNSSLGRLISDVRDRI